MCWLVDEYHEWPRWFLSTYYSSVYMPGQIDAMYNIMHCVIMPPHWNQLSLPLPYNTCFFLFCLPCVFTTGHKSWGTGHFDQRNAMVVDIGFYNKCKSPLYIVGTCPDPSAATLGGKKAGANKQTRHEYQCTITILQTLTLTLSLAS